MKKHTNRKPSRLGKNTRGFDAFCVTGTGSGSALAKALAVLPVFTGAGLFSAMRIKIVLTPNITGYYFSLSLFKIKYVLGLLQIYHTTNTFVLVQSKFY